MFFNVCGGWGVGAPWTDDALVVVNSSGVEENDDENEVDDGLGTYEVVDYTHVYGQL
jgi:hypothetical protein